LTDAEKAFGARYLGRLIFEPHIKAGASPNKAWGWERWQQLAKRCAAEGLAITQLGIRGTRILEGAEFVETETFRQACSVISRARAVVLQEGGCHHAAAAFAVPGVVIFGGFTPVELTGYPMHRNLGASLGEACGMRMPCAHCAEWMGRITPKQVFDELKGVLNAA
jgi:ADP-heptose:LPS heptosyltransferase